MAPRSKAVLAREHLDRALPAVAAQDHAEPVAWLFVALDAAIVAVADAHGLDTKQAHWRKAEVAAELHAAGVLPVDFAGTLKLLNEARKAVFYEGEDPDLGGRSLEDIASTVESAIDQAEQGGRMRTQDILVGLDDRETPAMWTRRLERDAAEIARRVPPELLELHGAVVDRARDAAAHGLILSGSTARSRRTAISDLDYHLIGPPILTRDLSSQLDLHTLSPAELDAHILTGDDFVQWSLRFGLIVFDDGHLRRAAQLIAAAKPWPDANRKRQHAAKSVGLARRMVASGDQDAAQEQVRTALSLAARARLLHAGVFPGARDELPQQLAELGMLDVGDALAATIHTDNIPLSELALAVDLCDALVSAQHAVPIA